MGPLPQRVTLVTLGVADVAASRRFYEGLGFRAADFDSEGVAFFDMNGVIFAVFGREDLAEDAGVSVEKGDAFSRMSIAINLESEAAVDAAMAFAASKGGRVTQPARKVFWGGYAGYFADPDGYLWEIAYNPFWPLDANGRPQLPPPRSA
jgi:catechol 2,3-dioxygenase-like lactoylglutathione lyase family enzyme